MQCEVEFTDDFENWWDELDIPEQATIEACVRMLQTHGVTLGHPYSSDIRGSRFTQMRELRPQHKGRPYRILYAFDPRRMAILLIGGDKTGDARWYEQFVPVADRLYEEHLQQLNKEGLIDG